VSSPDGLAIDPAARRIYWANSAADSISVANLDGSDGHTLQTPGAPQQSPGFPALLETPSGTAPPEVSGGTAPGSKLTCSTGSWAPDSLSSRLYRTPRAFAFQWSQDGTNIPGAVAAFLTADAPGDYRCTVTASNAAGGGVQASAAHIVSAPTGGAQPPGQGPTGGVQHAFGARTLVTLALAAKRIPARGPIKLRVANANDFPITGTLSAQTTSAVSVSRKRRVKLKARAISVGASAKTTVSLRLPTALRRLLVRNHKLSLRVTAKVKDPAGNTRTVQKRIAPKARR
jgi:hypothetical protein